MARVAAVFSSLFAAVTLTLLAACSGPHRPAVDEAQSAGRDAASFPHAGEDYFHDMDGAIALTPEEIKGRNMWNVWTGGNDRFWDGLTTYSFGAIDFLKVITSRPGQKYSRPDRWTSLGVVNEPCFSQPTGPDPNRFGLWLDVRDPSCPPDPFADPAKYRGVAIGERGKSMPVGSFYGEPTGVVGLRLFPNPAFDAAARGRWDPKRYYDDPGYYNDPKLVRPYRVGMACGFCHVGPSPTHPPADPQHPTWADLSSTVGTEYMRVDRLFMQDSRQSNFMLQWLASYRPGTMDTSLIATDGINNPRNMNAIYNLGDRMANAAVRGKEQLAGGGLNNKLNEFIHEGPLTAFFKAPDTVFTPHILKDGADSVGPLGALNRVHFNIGLFSEEWQKHFNPVVGGRPMTPIRIADAERNSAYWRATELGTPNEALFFLKAGRPDYLANAPGGRKYLAQDAALVDRGKTVFAVTCARCHSSKAPTPPPGADVNGCAGPNYLVCFARYWAWSKTDDFKARMTAIVRSPDFLANNYLSNDMRIPVTLLRTNACSPLATNAVRGNVWDNFSSESYKTLPSVGVITVRDPFTGEPRRYAMPAGGRGYSRVPSLVSIWSTAPFLLNNSVGPFTDDVSVDGRMSVFNASIEQLLWPAKREQDSVLGSKVHGVIDRTRVRGNVTIPYGYLPDALKPLQPMLRRLAPWLVGRDTDQVVLGPIPAGIPLNILADVKLLPEGEDPARHAAELLQLAVRLRADLKSLPRNATDAQLRMKFFNLREPLLKLSKCPDYVANRGHLFGTTVFNLQQTLSPDERAFGPEPELTDADRHALIAFLKTF